MKSTKNDNTFGYGYYIFFICYSVAYVFLFFNALSCVIGEVCDTWQFGFGLFFVGALAWITLPFYAFELLMQICKKQNIAWHFPLIFNMAFLFICFFMMNFSEFAGCVLMLLNGVLFGWQVVLTLRNLDKNDRR